MVYRLMADLVVVLHGAFILFACLGAILVLRRRCWAWFHIPALLWAGFIELAGGTCPLTPLENSLRALGGGTIYREDFIGRYLLPLIYPDELTRSLQVGLGALLLTVNTIIYISLWRRSRGSQL